jgi:hypothetical protein
MRAMDIAQSGAIGRYIAQRKREGASNASLNRETQVLGQMFRLAADDQHRLITGLVPQIKTKMRRRGRESSPRSSLPRFLPSRQHGRSRQSRL